MCFGGRKTREEQKICLKICFFWSSCDATTAARKVDSSSTLIGPFEFERECKGSLNLSARSNFKWTNQGWGWNHLANGCCREPHHKNFRKAREANFSFFTSLSTAKAHGFEVKFIELSGAVDLIAIRTFPLRRKRFVEWLLTSDGWSGLPFHSFRRRSNGFK